jgi:hypothetical protein
VQIQLIWHLQPKVTTSLPAVPGIMFLICAPLFECNATGTPDCAAEKAGQSTFEVVPDAVFLGEPVVPTANCKPRLQQLAQLWIVGNIKARL